MTGGKREYKKRVPMDELVRAVINFKRMDKFNRADFEELCPVANADGACGFEVVKSVLTFL